MNGKASRPPVTTPVRPADVVARQPWEIGERGLQLATIVDTAAPDRILAYVYLPEDDRAAGLRTLDLMVAAPQAVAALGALARAIEHGRGADVDTALAAAEALLERLGGPTP